MDNKIRRLAIKEALGDGVAANALDLSQLVLKKAEEPVEIPAELPEEGWSYDGPNNRRLLAWRNVMAGQGRLEGSESWPEGLYTDSASQAEPIQTVAGAPNDLVEWVRPNRRKPLLPRWVVKTTQLGLGIARKVPFFFELEVTDDVMAFYRIDRLGMNLLPDRMRYTFEAGNNAVAVTGSSRSQDKALHPAKSPMKKYREGFYLASGLVDSGVAGDSYSSTFFDYEAPETTRMSLGSVYLSLGEIDRDFDTIGSRWGFGFSWLRPHPGRTLEDDTNTTDLFPGGYHDFWSREVKPMHDLNDISQKFTVRAFWGDPLGYTFRVGGSMVREYDSITGQPFNTPELTELGVAGALNGN